MTQLTKTEQTTDVLTAEQAVMVDEIKSYHEGVKRAFDHQAQYAFMTGLKLLALKASVPHGNSPGSDGFIAIRKKFLPELSNGTTGRYMDFAKRCQEKFPTVGNINPQVLQLTNGDLPEEQKKQVLKAVHEIADGKTWTQLYRELGKVREPKPAAHHPRGPINAKEESAARQKRFERMAGDCAISMRALISEKLLLQSLPEDKLDELNDWRVELGNAIAKIKQSRAAGKRGKNKPNQT